MELQSRKTSCERIDSGRGVRGLSGKLPAVDRGSQCKVQRLERGFLAGSAELEGRGLERLEAGGPEETGQPLLAVPRQLFCQSDPRRVGM